MIRVGGGTRPPPTVELHEMTYRGNTREHPVDAKPTDLVEKGRVEEKTETPWN